jgi:replication-associated recombination protein RarA
MSLFDNMPQVRSSIDATQNGFNFPQSLVERYRPRSLSEFVGIERVKRVLNSFIAKPFPNAAFLFVGGSGVGKTSCGLVLCEMLRAELHHVPSQCANLATIEEVVRQCYYVPKNGTYHLILIDEIDAISRAASLALLSKMDATGFPPSTIFVLTSNSVEGLEPRFLSRCMVLPFQSHGVAKDAATFLEQIWQKEAGDLAERPNFLRIVQDSKNNIRDAVNSLQVELLSV